MSDKTHGTNSEISKQNVLYCEYEATKRWHIWHKISHFILGHSTIIHVSMSVVPPKKVYGLRNTNGTSQSAFQHLS